MFITDDQTAIGKGTALILSGADSFTYQISNTFVGSWSIQATIDGGQTYIQIDSGTAVKGPITYNPSPTWAGKVVSYYVQIDAYTSGTVTGKLVRLVSATTVRHRLSSSFKAGTTAGVVVGAGNNVSLTTCPASQTASTAVASHFALSVGDTISGFYLAGELTSAGGTVTVDAALIKQVVTAGVVTNTTLGTMAQISKTANALIDKTASFWALTADEVVAENTSYFILVTITTGASCTVTLLGALLEFTPQAAPIH